MPGDKSVTIALMNGAGMHAPDSAAVVSPSRYNGSMRVYLDNCCFQRPLDNKSQVRVRLESEAVLAILSLWEQHQIEVISSEALEFELAQNPDPVRRAYVAEIVSGAAIRVQVDHAISMRAKELEAGGLRGMDALRIACAEAAGADYFCSCDDRLLRRARVIEGLRVKVVSLLVLAGELAQ
jgi:predicted nucleic acid-binding protein